MKYYLIMRNDMAGPDVTKHHPQLKLGSLTVAAGQEITVNDLSNLITD